MDEPVHIPKRKPLTRAQRAKVFAAGKGCCYICSARIHPGDKWEADHVTSRELSGSDALAEHKPAHVGCHKGKTAKDKKIISKVKRVQQKHLGLKKKSKWRGWRKMDGSLVWSDDEGRS